MALRFCKCSQIICKSRDKASSKLTWALLFVVFIGLPLEMALISACSLVMFLVSVVSVSMIWDLSSGLMDLFFSNLDINSYKKLKSHCYVRKKMNSLVKSLEVFGNLSQQVFCQCIFLVLLNMEINQTKLSAKKNVKTNYFLCFNMLLQDLLLLLPDILLKLQGFLYELSHVQTWSLLCTGKGPHISTQIKRQPFIVDCCTCFFLRASEAAPGLRKDKAFWEAFNAAGLYTVLVNPIEVERTCRSWMNNQAFQFLEPSEGHLKLSSAWIISFSYNLTEYTFPSAMAGFMENPSRSFTGTLAVFCWKE